MGKYDKDYMKIKFNSNYDIPLNKQILCTDFYTLLYLLH